MLPIEIFPLGQVNLRKPVQYEKAPFPIEIETPFKNSIEFKVMQL